VSDKDILPRRTVRLFVIVPRAGEEQSAYKDAVVGGHKIELNSPTNQSYAGIFSNR
jgi:hypothetical protein